jgi:hypothetical protein
MLGEWVGASHAARSPTLNWLFRTCLKVTRPLPFTPYRSFTLDNSVEQTDELLS